MTTQDIVEHRLLNQQIVGSKFKDPVQIVKWMGAMQAQDFTMAKWGLGLRLPHLYDGDIEQAFNDGLILRTHVLRPTWHFVLPIDIRWMLELTAPHVKQICGYMDHKYGLDNKIFTQSNDVLKKVLRGNKQLTRSVLKSALGKRKIDTDGPRLGLILLRAELDGIICSGGREDKQFTYALLEEKVPHSKKLTREESLTTLTKRYFTSRGPATLNDFAWWSGLTMNDVRAGVESLPKEFLHKKIQRQEYFYKSSLIHDSSVTSERSTFLLPDFDEYVISYKDRSAFLNLSKGGEVNHSNLLFNHILIVNGFVAGTWKRVTERNTLKITTFPFSPLKKSTGKKVEKAVSRYSSFSQIADKK